MKRIILVYSAIPAVLITVLMITSALLYQKYGYTSSEIIGYASIILSFLTIFFGVSAYRKSQGGAPVSFGKGFLIGLWISIIASAVYSLVWLIMYYTVFPDFMDNYGKHMIEKLKNSGASQKVIDEKMAQLKMYRELYKNPIYIFGFTFLEPFPIGLLFSLIAGAIFRRPSKQQAAA